MTDKIKGIINNAFDAFGITDKYNDVGQKGGQSSIQNRGWYGDSERHQEAGKKAAQTSSERYGENFHEEIGAKGGRASQKSGNAHELTSEERSEGGKS